MPKKKVFQIGRALTAGLTETVAVAHSHMGEISIEALPLQKIELDPDNPRELVLTFEDLRHGITPDDPMSPRKRMEKESLESLAASINAQGILNPVLVYKAGESYRLIAGERRTLAAILAGKQSIQARIFDKKPTELNLRLLQWIENMERKDLTLWEKLRNIEKVLEAYTREKGTHREEITLADLALLLGCAKTQAKNYKDVLGANTHLKNLIKDNMINNLEKAALIATASTPEKQQQLLEACLQGATLKMLKNMQQEQKLVPKLIKLETRGRPTFQVQLGSTKNIKVAKHLIEHLLTDERLHLIKAQFSDLNWDDYRLISNKFKQLIKFLETKV